MKSLQQHHADSIRFGYSCFDRMILNGSIPQFLHTKRAGTIVWFLRSQRQAPQLNRAYFAKISSAYHDWVDGFAKQTGVDMIDAQKDVRRQDWVEPFYQQLGARYGVAVILKAREPERVAWHHVKTNSIAVERRHVNLYYFYLNDPDCGRMFLRICPYFPCNIRVWLNGHHWLANQLRSEGIPFEQCGNLFTDCAKPERLQELADAFCPEHIIQPVQAWLARLLPYFNDNDRQLGFRHELFMTQMEYCHNLIFHKQAYVERLFDRLMDANRSVGHPDQLAIYFGRPKLRLDTRTGQTTLRINKDRIPVLTSSFHKTAIKQYISDGVGLRTESTAYQLQDLHMPKNLKNMPRLRQILSTANDRYLSVQQDVLLSYVDRGQMQQLRQPTVSPTGRRTPGLRIDDPRLIAVLQAITRFAYLAGHGCFRTKDLLLDVQNGLNNPSYTLGQLRYDLNKLRGKGLVVRLPGTQTYQLTDQGYEIAILYLKLFQRLYAPLTAAILDPIAADNKVLTRQLTKLDRLYAAVDHALKRLTAHLGVAA